MKVKSVNTSLVKSQMSNLVVKSNIKAGPPLRIIPL